jgi:hypothetical protein
LLATPETKAAGEGLAAKQAPHRAAVGRIFNPSGKTRRFEKPSYTHARQLANELATIS